VSGFLALNELQRSVDADPCLRLYWIRETVYDQTTLETVPTGWLAKGAPVWVQTDYPGEPSQVVGRYRVAEKAKVEDARLHAEGPSPMTRRVIMNRLECL